MLKIFFFIAVVLFCRLCETSAQSVSLSDGNSVGVETLLPHYAKVIISPDLHNGVIVSLADPIVLHLNEKLLLSIVFSPELQDKQIDHDFLLSNPEQIDGSILQWDESLPEEPWIPQSPGCVTLEFQIAWHDKGLSTGFGRNPIHVPIIINKNGPSNVETLRITINVVE